MDSLSSFKQKLNERNAQLIVSMKLPGMVYGATLSESGTITLNSGADSERFVGLSIDVNTMRYNPLQKMPFGHRFFSFEGIKEIEITANQFAPGYESPDLREAFTFSFEVDPHKYALMNSCTTMLFTALSQNLTASWTRKNSRLLVRNGKDLVVDQQCDLSKYNEVISKLKQDRIRNFY